MTTHIPGRTAERPWSVTVRPDEIPELGRHIEIEAGAEVRAELAKPVGVDAVERLAATFDLTRRGRDGLHVRGRVTGTVRQTCVVSLEPVLNDIDEEIEADFAPLREDAKADLDDIDGASGAADEPEPLVGGMADLGLLATEFLILGIDPHPRKPGVAFEAPAASNPQANPFAALAGWNKKGTVKE